MNHFEWALQRIEQTVSGQDDHPTHGVQALLDGLLALQGRSPTGLFFGMSTSSLIIADGERANLIESIRAALLAKHQVAVRTADEESLQEFSKLADLCELPALRFQSEREPLRSEARGKRRWLEWLEFQGAPQSYRLSIIPGQPIQFTDDPAEPVAWPTGWPSPDGMGLDLILGQVAGSGVLCTSVIWADGGAGRIFLVPMTQEGQAGPLLGFLQAMIENTALTSVPAGDPGKCFNPSEMNSPSLHLRIRYDDGAAWQCHYPLNKVPKNVRAFLNICRVVAQKLVQSGPQREVDLETQLRLVDPGTTPYDGGNRFVVLKSQKKSWWKLWQSGT